MFLAERMGFEPMMRFRRIHAFQACAFDRSATSPGLFSLKVESNNQAAKVIKNCMIVQNLTIIYY